MDILEQKIYGEPAKMAVSTRQNGGINPPKWRDYNKDQEITKKNIKETTTGNVVVSKIDNEIEKINEPIAENRLPVRECEKSTLVEREILTGAIDQAEFAQLVLWRINDSEANVWLDKYGVLKIAEKIRMCKKANPGNPGGWMRTALVKDYPEPMSISSKNTRAGEQEAQEIFRRQDEKAERVKNSSGKGFEEFKAKHSKKDNLAQTL